MQLSEILKDVEIVSVHADLSMEISNIQYDSRKVAPGGLFVAYQGTVSDGHAYIGSAVALGASCVICEHDIEDTIPYVVVKDGRKTLSIIGANWFDHPSTKMKMVGITGTNGKTTTTYLIKSILEQKANVKVGLIGTIQNMVGPEVIETERTTPESFDLQGLFAQMVAKGCTHCVMEVSSHALSLQRVYGVHFDIAVFTNLTQDHLDFHKTMEEYCSAKSILFENCSLAIVNADDPWKDKVLAHSLCRRLTYAVENDANMKAYQVELHASGVDYDIDARYIHTHVQVKIPGIFTVYNTLAAISTCCNLGVTLEDCAEALTNNHGVRGRMEIIPTPGKNYTIVSDYAHTPDALENVIRACKGFAKGRTVAVFGCGGDRDATKRPIMGHIAGSLADYCIVTSDNPRTEDPKAITDDILTGMQEFSNYTVVVDRIEAIHYAMDHALENDIIILAGKGHEDYQEVNHQKHHMDEREIVADYLAK